MYSRKLFAIVFRFYCSYAIFLLISSAYVRGMIFFVVRFQINFIRWLRDTNISISVWLPFLMVKFAVNGLKIDLLYRIVCSDLKNPNVMMSEIKNVRCLECKCWLNSKAFYLPTIIAQCCIMLKQWRSTLLLVTHLMGKNIVKDTTPYISSFLIRIPRIAPCFKISGAPISYMSTSHAKGWWLFHLLFVFLLFSLHFPTYALSWLAFTHFYGTARSQSHGDIQLHRYIKLPAGLHIAL